MFAGGAEVEDCRGDGKEAEALECSCSWTERCVGAGLRESGSPQRLQGGLVRSQCSLAGQCGPCQASAPPSALPVRSSSLGDRDKVKERTGKGSQAGAARPHPQAGTNPERSGREGELLSPGEPVPHAGFRGARAGGRAPWAGAPEGLREVV